MEKKGGGGEQMVKEGNVTLQEKNTTTIHINKMEEQMCYAVEAVRIEEEAVPVCARADGMDCDTDQDGYTEFPSTARHGFINNACVAQGPCDITHLVLGSDVKEVNNHAFKGHSQLEYVDASAARDVTFGEECFAACANLKGIILPMVDVPRRCFRNCPALTRVIFQGEDSGEVYTIGAVAFALCTKLESVENMPRRVVYGAGAFSRCFALRHAFVVGGQDQPALPDNLFLCCNNIRSLVLLEGTEGTGHSMCKGCTRLQQLVLPESLVHIRKDTFARCRRLEEVRCGANLHVVDAYAFEQCERLEKITITSLKNVCFYDRVFGQCRALKTFTVPMNTERLGDYMFWGCNELKTVVLNAALTRIGDGCFSACTALENCDLERAPRLQMIGAYSFKQTALARVDLSNMPVTEIGMYAFAAMRRLETLLLPPTLRVVEEGMCFECLSLTKLTFPASVLEVPYLCCYGCAVLTEVEVLGATTVVNANAFGECAQLAVVQRLQIV